MVRFIFSFFIASFVTFSAFAGSPKKVCNDLKVSQCKKRVDCTWVKKSKKMDRKAYCRMTGKKMSKKKSKGKNKTL